MGDQPDPQTDDPKQDPDPTPDPDAGAKAALAAERKARRDAEKSAGDLRAKLKEFEDKDKTDTQRASDEAATATKRAEKAEQDLLRYQVAFDKGLTAAQAKRLVGATREELEEDAAEILEAFPSTSGGGSSDDAKSPPPSRKPSPDLQGGTDPTKPVDDLDPVKLAEAIPRP